MKKILFISAVSAVVLGLAQTSQAGVHVNIGFGLPFPSVVVTRPAPVVVETAPVCAPVVVAAPCAPVVVQPAPVVVTEPVYYPVYRHGHYWHDGWGRSHGFRR